MARDQRIDIEKPVAVKFDRFEDFVTEVSQNLSASGMFIGTDRVHPPGSTFDFVLQLADDLNMVQGRAEVVWSRPRSEGPDRPAGMGIRFLEMDATSEAVLQRLIEHHSGQLPQAAPAVDDAPADEGLGADTDELGGL